MHVTVHCCVEQMLRAQVSLCTVHAGCEDACTFVCARVRVCVLTRTCVYMCVCVCSPTLDNLVIDLLPNKV